MSLTRKHSFGASAAVAAVVLLAPAAMSAQSAPLSMSLESATIGAGSVSTLRLTMVNQSAGPMTALGASVTLPAGVLVADPSRTSSTCFGEVLAAAGGASISFDGGSLAPGASCVVAADITSAAVGSHALTGSMTSSAGGGTAGTTLIVATDRPAFAKSFAPALVAFGSRTRLTLSINNAANTAAVANLTVTDPLPNGMSVASPANATTTCTGGTVTAVPGASTVSYGPAFFGDASVAAGASCAVAIDVIAGAAGTSTNVTGVLTSTGPFGGPSLTSGKASAAIVAVAQRLTLIKEFVGDPVAPGGTVGLQYTVLNLDRRSAASDITFSDDLDAALAGLVATTLPSTPCGPSSALGGSSVLTLTGGTLEPEASCVFTVVLTVPPTAGAGSYPGSTSDITGLVDGVPVVGAPASDTLAISAVPVLTMAFTDDPVSPPADVTVEFSLANTDFGFPLTGLSFSADFPAFVESAPGLPPAGFCGPGSAMTFQPAGNNPARLLVTGSSVAAGASCNFSATLGIADDAPDGIFPAVTSPPTGTINGEVVAGGAAGDDLVVVRAPRLRLTFLDEAVAAGATTTARFQLSRSPEASGPASAITFTHDLELALAGLTAVNTPLADVCGLGSAVTGTMTVHFSGGALAAGETCSFDVSLLVPSAAPPGNYPSSTSAVVATVLGVQATSPLAVDTLRIAGLSLSKEFVGDPVLPGDNVLLRFVLRNDSGTTAATDISFTDDLDATADGLAAIGLPLADVCGSGSLLSGSPGNTLLTLTGASLPAGGSCVIDVDLLVPSTTPGGEYVNLTSVVTATVDGQSVTFARARDNLRVAQDVLGFTKEFIETSAGPGDQVTLRFTIVNQSKATAIDMITFQDDLEAALTGLASASGTVVDPCGAGSQLTGVSALELTGGSLAAGASCTFEVQVEVPATVGLGAVAHNVTSAISGVAGGTLPVAGPPAVDDLAIEIVAFSKSFKAPVLPGETGILTFTLENRSTTAIVRDLFFQDDLEQVLSGLVAVGLPETDVCGVGSVLSGSSQLVLAGATLLPDGACSFSVQVNVPAGAKPGTYLNVTSPLRSEGRTIAPPATADLVVFAESDSDDDGVLDVDDVCPGTVIPEGVPTVELRPNRYALVNDDFVFDTVKPGSVTRSRPPGHETFTTTSTAGCSCEQIIEALGLGNGHTKFGCSIGAMRTWVDLVNSVVDGRAFR